MWSRSVLKKNAKEALRGYYWPAVLVCFISGILSGSYLSNGSPLQLQFQMNRSSTSGSSPIKVSFQLPALSDAQFWGILLFFLTTILVLTVIFTLLSIFVGNILLVGKFRYFLESRYQGQSAGIGCLFSGFSDGHYVNIMKCMFFRDLFVFLWSLLLIIPGIYKHYEYYMVPYLLSEYPDLDRREAFQRSKEMMDGNKFDTWVLELSFIGWLILSSLTCGLGIIFVAPYYEATFLELYLNLKQHVYGNTRQVETDVIDQN